jgi:hypothetical protein
MDERKSQIALALLRIQFRQRVTLRDIPNLKREVGNLIKEPEMTDINVEYEELLDFLKNLLQEVFDKQMKAI